MGLKRSRTTVTILRPSPQSKLAHLNDEQHVQLCRWLLVSGLPLHKIADNVQKEFGFHTNAHALSQYFQRYCAQYIITRRQRNVDLALGVAGAMQDNPAEFVPLALDNLKRLVWNLTEDPNSNPKTIKVFYELILRSEENEIRREQLEVKSRRVRLLEKKQKMAEEALTDSTLNDAQFADRIRKIFKRDEQISNKANGQVPSLPDKFQRHCLPA
jgi:hypothetical protein